MNTESPEPTPKQPLPDTKGPDGKHTYRDVAAALQIVKDRHDRPAAMKILKDVGDGGNIREISPNLYDAVYAAACKLVPEMDSLVADKIKLDQANAVKGKVGDSASEALLE